MIFSPWIPAVVGVTVSLAANSATQPLPSTSTAARQAVDWLATAAAIAAPTRHGLNTPLPLVPTSTADAERRCGLCARPLDDGRCPVCYHAYQAYNDLFPTGTLESSLEHDPPADEDWSGSRLAAAVHASLDVGRLVRLSRQQVADLIELATAVGESAVCHWIGRVAAAEHGVLDRPLVDPATPPEPREVAPPEPTLAETYPSMASQVSHPSATINPYFTPPPLNAVANLSNGDAALPPEPAETSDGPLPSGHPAVASDCAPHPNSAESLVVATASRPVLLGAAVTLEHLADAALRLSNRCRQLAGNPAGE